MTKVHIPDVGGVLCGSNRFTAQISARGVCTTCLRIMWDAIGTDDARIVTCMGTVFRFPDGVSYRRFLRTAAKGAEWQLEKFGATNLGVVLENVTDLTPERAQEMLQEDRARTRVAKIPELEEPKTRQGDES